MSDTIETDEASDEVQRPATPPEATKLVELQISLTGADGKAVTHLVLREPTHGEVCLAEMAMGGKSDLRSGRLYQAKLLSLVSGVDVQTLDTVPVRAFMDAVRYLDAWVKLNDIAPARENANSSNPEGLLIPLVTPVSALGHDCTELQLSELTMTQLKKAETYLKDYTALDIRNYKGALVAQSSGFKRPLIDKLPVSVVNEAAAYVQSFMSPAAPATGA